MRGGRCYLEEFMVLCEAVFESERREERRSGCGMERRKKGR